MADAHCTSVSRMMDVTASSSEGNQIRTDIKQAMGLFLFLLLPRKADGETVPLLRATMTLMPVSTNGTEKSMISERSSLMVREPMAMSARLYTT